MERDDSMTIRLRRLHSSRALLVLCIACGAFPCVPVVAQQTDPATPSPSPPVSQGPDQKAADAEKEARARNSADSPANDRIFYAVPNFLTVENAGQVPPLTAGQKFKFVAQDSFDLFNYPWYAFIAGLGQAADSDPGYGQGAKGYGKRYAANFADGTIENFMTGAVFPSMLHQDPRYFQLGKGTVLHRVGYSASRIFITRTDSGHSQFNYSEIAGAAVSAGIANAYRPAAERNLGNTMSIWWTDIGWDTFTLMMKEFWPDIRRKLHKEKN